MGTNDGLQVGASYLWQNPGLLFRPSFQDFVSFTNYSSTSVPSSLQVQTFTLTAWVISTNDGSSQGLIGGDGANQGMPELRINTYNQLELLDQGLASWGVSTA